MQSMTFKIILSVTSIALALAHLIWPNLGIDAITISLVVLAAIPWLLPHLKSMELPGGVKIELNDVKGAAELVIEGTKLSQPINNQNINSEADLDNQVQLLREIGGRDPNLMMVGFRIEVEKRLLELSKVNGLSLSRTPLPRVINILRENEILTPNVASGLSDLIGLGNRAAHGAEVAPEAARWVLEFGVGVLKALDTLILIDKHEAPNN